METTNNPTYFRGSILSPMIGKLVSIQYNGQLSRYYGQQKGSIIIGILESANDLGVCISYPLDICYSTTVVYSEMTFIPMHSISELYVSTPIETKMYERAVPNK